MLGIPVDAFGSGSEGGAHFATWLGQKNGRDLSWVASNLLGLLFIIVKNTPSIFSQFKVKIESISLCYFPLNMGADLWEHKGDIRCD